MEVISMILIIMKLIIKEKIILLIEEIKTDKGRKTEKDFIES